MPDALELRDDGASVAIAAGSRLLLRYVYAPAGPGPESPRPYAHPVNSLAGDTLSAFRPNDHPWHHGLSLTFTSVDGVNFWGGPSWRPGEGYRWRDDHGRQRHREWLEMTPGRLRHTLDWTVAKTGESLLSETRDLAIALAGQGWTLGWRSRLANVSGRSLAFGQYESAGLAGSHYTGLQFRGARALLDEHGDSAIRLCSEGGREGEPAVHGAPARWMEWHVQSDESLRRTVIRFENRPEPIPWFVRRNYPLAAFAVHRERAFALEAGAALELDHRLEFLSPP